MTEDIEQAMAEGRPWKLLSIAAAEKDGGVTLLV
jgi:hypothetical protein